MDAFKIKKGGKVLDYRRSAILDIDRIRMDFSKKFEVLSVRQPGRHVIIDISKNGEEYILKLASTEGVGARTEGEKLWNDEFNKYSKSQEFRVPKNLEDGYYNGLYYLIIEKFEGEHLSTLRGENNIVEEFIDKIIAFSELIQNLPLNIPSNDLIENHSAQDWFVEKTKSWYKTVDSETIYAYGVQKLLEIVENGSKNLEEKPRHGDFTPWHMIALKNRALGLIDGEHAHSHGVEHYDIAYFIQRVYSVINRKNQAELILKKLLDKKVNKGSLRTVLASRAIGGFCDEFLTPVPNFKKALEFKEFVMSI